MPKEIGIDENVLKRFASLEQKGLLAHAYLFTGPAYIGKGLTARAVAKFFNCEGEKTVEKYFCDQCPACVKINAGSHPDVHMIRDDEGGQSIGIETIRGLLAQVRLRPLLGAKKIFIIHQAENLTTEAANALLKTLEEPSASSLLILTTGVPARLLETVRSRCHTIPFVPPSPRELAANLIRYYDENEARAHFLACFAEGCPGKARRFRENGLCAAKDEMIDRFILGREREVLLKTIAVDKTKTREFLDVVLSWVRDCLLWKTGVRDRLVHADRAIQIQNFQRQFSFGELLGVYRETVNACRLLVENLNIKIPLSIIGEMLYRVP